MSAPHVNLDCLPSLCQKLPELVEIWRSYDKNYFACFFWDTVYILQLLLFLMCGRQSQIYQFKCKDFCFCHGTILWLMTSTASQSSGTSVNYDTVASCSMETYHSLLTEGLLTSRLDDIDQSYVLFAGESAVRNISWWNRCYSTKTRRGIKGHGASHCCSTADLHGRFVSCTDDKHVVDWN